MRVIYKKRASGKTTELIKLSVDAKDSYYIVCRSHKEARRICEQAKEMGLHIPFPLTYAEFLGKKYYTRGIKGFLIDDVDALLSYMSSVPIYAIIITNECVEK